MKFKLTGKGSIPTKGHYVVEKGHQHPSEQKYNRLDEKVEKYKDLPKIKAKHVGDQSSHPLPSMRKY